MADLTNFNPAIVKTAYSAAEWTQKEEWYTNSLVEIVPSENPTPAYSQAMLVKLDAVATVANLDAARVITNFENYKKILEIEESRMRITVQNSQMTVGKKDPAKLTVNDIDSLVTECIAMKPWNGNKRTLYEIIAECRSRANFMKNVQSIIQMKISEFVTTSANIKSEIALNGMTPSVPRD